MKRFSLALFLIVLASAGVVAAHGQRPIVLNPERAGHAATLLTSGKVLISGGVNERETLTSALLYDPTGPRPHRLKRTGLLTSARADHTSTLLLDGRVLVTGGDLSDGHQIKSGEIYDPVTGLFTQISQAMSIPRSHHTATLLEDGKVLLGGGKSASRFDPVAQSFTSTPGTPINRKSHAAVRLPDGTVLITGGYVGGLASTSAEIYDPTTQTFTALTTTMLLPRANHEMTLLQNGTVLITGG